MMDWPSKIALRFLKQGKVIQKLLVFLLVKSPFKNDFPLGFFLTDSDGVIRLSREEILSKIERAKEDSPMDYDGDLDECNGLEVVIDSAEALDARIQYLKRFYPANAEEIQRHADLSCNKEFQNLKMIEQTPIKEEIDIALG
jgi:hypothetical protein